MKAKVGLEKCNGETKNWIQNHCKVQVEVTLQWDLSVTPLEMTWQVDDRLDF